MDSKAKFLKFLEASGLGFSRASVLLNLGVSSPTLLKISPNALGRLLFIEVWEWVSDTWRSLIGDTCHSLIGPLMSSLTCTELHMSSLTHAGLLVSSLICADVRLGLA